MNKPIGLFLTILIMSVALAVPPAFSHVVPEDQLRNRVYLTPKEALKKVFEGVRKIKKEKRKVNNQRVVFYTADTGGQKLYAIFGKAYANSHPVTEAKFILLVDAKGHIKDIHIMEYRGPQRAEIISRSFLEQYFGKSADSDFTTVTSNQGPTPPVQALNEAVLRTLATFKGIYRKS